MEGQQDRRGVRWRPPALQSEHFRRSLSSFYCIQQRHQAVLRRHFRRWACVALLRIHRDRGGAIPPMMSVEFYHDLLDEPERTSGFHQRKAPEGTG